VVLVARLLGVDRFDELLAFRGRVRRDHLPVGLAAGPVVGGVDLHAVELVAGVVLLDEAEVGDAEAIADTLDVFVPHAPSAAQARRELDLYLATWRARHPDVEADVLER
jgi:hypothetical protein